MSRHFHPKAFSALTIDGFDVTDGAFAGHYTLRGSDPADDVSFSETVNFGTTLRKPPDDRLLRLLTLTCVPSYYKAAAPPRIEIAFPTFDFERTYLRELIAGGLGEFAYRNDLPDALGPEITGPQAGATSSGVGDDDWDGTRTPLVPVGGGKDSVVTIEALKRHGLRPMLFSVNKFDPIDRCVEVSGLDSTHVTRFIDRRLIEVNGEGAYNGHVPVTAINSVI
ncbi:MAG: UDP-N-acetyl-alpha-D-muramoyl-L-alanyl-L-glutamate epimerase, partial [Mycobacterium sp.]|nr:UDP-N-acetyl-alpha-D-muramoyl-L-alanyl-L-glutamate epimerase [Mycobacterium sp.]